MPQFTHAMDVFPGVPKSWGYTWLINDADAPTGRPAGSVGWAGLVNCFYWIDRRNGIGGFWATQLLPFLDPATFEAFLAFESLVYAHAG
jgi:methyl acetate hydrolase